MRLPVFCVVCPGGFFLVRSGYGQIEYRSICSSTGGKVVKATVATGVGATPSWMSSQKQQGRRSQCDVCGKGPVWISRGPICWGRALPSADAVPVFFWAWIRPPCSPTARTGLRVKHAGSVCLVAGRRSCAGERRSRSFGEEGTWCGLRDRLSCPRPEKRC